MQCTVKLYVDNAFSLLNCIYQTREHDHAIELKPGSISIDCIRYRKYRCIPQE